MTIVESMVGAVLGTMTYGEISLNNMMLSGRFVWCCVRWDGRWLRNG